MTDELLLCLIMIPVLITGGYLLLRDRERPEVRTRSITIADLTAEVKEWLNEYGIREDRGRGLNSENTLKTEESVAEALGNCCSGLKGPRDVMLSVVRQWLLTVVRPDEEELDGIFTKGDIWTEFECILFDADKRDNGRGFLKLWENVFKDIALCCGELDDIYVDDVFKKIYPRLNREDKTEIIGKIVYAGAFGFGKVDSVMWQQGCIEEIQLGLSGTTGDDYDFREEMGEKKIKKTFSRDSVHVMVGGIPVKLPFLAPGSDDELVRILRNLIKNTGAGELTKRTPRIVCDTPDGRRVTVSRPPFSDSWAGLVRKFDTVPKTSLEELVEDEDLRRLIGEILKTKKSIAVTGETASGKTTLLRALLLEMGKERSIRVIEGESFELNIRSFLPDANTLTLRVSDGDPADRVLGFSKKTTGQVFAVGEVNTPEMAVTLTDIAKTAETILFTAHYKETSDMVRDFTNARLNAGGYSDERLARSEAISALGIDIHMRRRGGMRCIERISEVQDDGTIKCLWPLQAVG